MKPDTSNPLDSAESRVRDPLSALWHPATVRARCAAIAQAVDDGRSGWFTVDRSALPATAERVVDLMQARFGNGPVPRHSRWRHFQTGGVDRLAQFEAALAGRSPQQALRARLDLTVISVLLDAGAGANWAYDEVRGQALQAIALPAQRQGRDELLAMLNQASGAVTPAGEAASLAASPAETVITSAVDSPVSVANATSVANTGAPEALPPAWIRRSEGLAVATLRAFMAGAFSGDDADPLRADARVLTQLDSAALGAIFQVRHDNPLAGLDGRAELLRRLGQLLEARQRRAPQSSAATQQLRPSAVLEPWLSAQAAGSATAVDAAELLISIVSQWAPIWAHGSRVLGLSAGDVWPHPWAGRAAHNGVDHGTEGWVPFHKLSQWLCYSLLEPLEQAGFQIHNEAALTALPEYRNGGLLLDGGVIVPRDVRDLNREWKVSHEWVVEWRALTVVLIDELAETVRQKLREQFGSAAPALSLAAILEGGTWAAGRALAQERRPGGVPPVRVVSDGTVF